MYSLVKSMIRDLLLQFDSLTAEEIVQRVRSIFPEVTTGFVFDGIQSLDSFGVIVLNPKTDEYSLPSEA